MKTQFFIPFLLMFILLNVCACSSKKNREITTEPQLEKKSETTMVIPNSQRYNYYKEKFISEGYDLNEPLGELWVSGDFCEDIVKINDIVNKYCELSAYTLVLPDSNKDFTCNILLDNYLNTMRIFYVGNALLTPDELYLVENYHEALLFLFMWAFISF